MAGSSRFATAVHILTLLAHEADEALTSEYIAGSVNTNPVVIRRLLMRLAEAGLVTSTPGTTGGSRLARDARRITLRDVFHAVETPALFGRHSQQPNPKCPVGREVVRVLHPHFDAAEEAALGRLGKTSIGDLVKEVSRRKR